MGLCTHTGDRKGLCLLFHYCPLISLRQRLSLNLGCRFAQLAWRPESSFRPPFSALLGIEATGRCEQEAWFVVSGCCDANFDRSCGFVSECFLLQLYQPPSAIPRVSTWRVVGILQIEYEIVSPLLFLILFILCVFYIICLDPIHLFIPSHPPSSPAHSPNNAKFKREKR